MTKRIFDFVASLGGLIVVGWLVVLLAVTIRRSSEGPGLFGQVRVGRNGVPFRCYKLRTMYVGTASVATHLHAGTAHITGMGRWLRRFKLDELPQLWNVLKGEMSLVGPRPCLPIQTELVDARRRLGVLALRPGITGKAQVLDIDMTDPQRLAQVDAAYLSERSFFGDIAILFRTFVG